MKNFKFDHITEDFVNAQNFKNSDLKYLSRQIIMRGIKEAEFRSFVNDGLKSKQYRQTMFDLMDAQERINTWFLEDGKVDVNYFFDMTKSLELSYLLVRVDFQDFEIVFKVLATAL